MEELVLSGKLFNPQSRSPSPRRSPSPDSKPNYGNWPDIDKQDEDDEETAHEKSQIDRILASKTNDGPGDGQNIGMGPGRTGVKGVLRDQAEAQARARNGKRQTSKKGADEGVGGKTFLEEEKEKEWERMMLEGLDSSAASKINGTVAGRFGHLREVGMSGFVSAVENEARGVWVVVHLYEPSLDRCFDVDATLTRLARLNHHTKFLRTRAGALGFASKGPSSSRNLRTTRKPPRIQEEDDERDEEDEDEEYDNVDLDVLPTLLVYRDGDLVHNWVRVDWEAGQAGVEELLRSHNILSSYAGAGVGNCGLPSDDEDLALEFEDEAGHSDT